MAFSTFDAEARKQAVKSALASNKGKFLADRYGSSGGGGGSPNLTETMALTSKKSSFFDNFSGGFSFGKQTWLPFALLAAFVAVVGVGIGRALAGKKKRRR